MHRALNFNAGPASLPLEVLQTVQHDMLNVADSGQSVLELSHRGSHFEAILASAHRSLYRLLGLEEGEWKLLFLQGGATLQFAAVPLNLLGNHARAAYLVTGTWSKQAAEEAQKYCSQIDLVASSGPDFRSMPMFDRSFLKEPVKDIAYLHYCHNETVNGVEFTDVPDLGERAPPLVADLSSCFLSRPLSLHRLSAFYAGAQKNIGPAGVTIVGVRSSLLDQRSASRLTATAMNWTLIAKASSMLNTPPCFAIYVTSLVLAWLEKQSLSVIADQNEAKAKLLYETIDSSQGFYIALVDRECRSLMNVVFRLQNKTLEADFISRAEKEKDIVGIAGHRSMGGCRASLYNAVTLAQCQVLVDYMIAFAEQHR